jgi:hypothetical protein
LLWGQYLKKYLKYMHPNFYYGSGLHIRLHIHLLKMFIKHVYIIAFPANRRDRIIEKR